MKETRYFAVVGCKNYYGAQILKRGAKMAEVTK